MFPIFMIYILPVSLIACCIILVLRFGPIGLVCLGMLTSGVFMQMLMAKFYQRFAAQRSKFNDQRVKLCNEVVEGIRLIKIYTWEGEFTKMIEEIRKKELFKSFLLLFFIYLSGSFSNVLNFFSLLTQIYVLYEFDFEEHITLGKIFSTLELLQFMKFQLFLVGYGLTGLKDFYNILERAKTILLMKPVELRNIEDNQTNFALEQ